MSLGFDRRLAAAPNQSTDVDPDETGKQNARLIGNHDDTKKLSESSVDWSGTNVEWKNGTIDEVRTICWRKVSDYKTCQMRKKMKRFKFHVVNMD